MHGMGYCEAVEHIMGIEIPPRAKYLRTIWCEMSRIHSHMLWLGLLADAFGFESLFMQSWRIREKTVSYTHLNPADMAGMFQEMAMVGTVMTLAVTGVWALMVWFAEHKLSDKQLAPAKRPAEK